jgi:hypothetical protein
MPKLLPVGALGEVVFDNVVGSYDEETAKKDPEFYSKSHTELRNALIANKEGRPLTLSKAAQNRLAEEVQSVVDHNTPIVREQALRWLKEHR